MRRIIVILGFLAFGFEVPLHSQATKAMPARAECAPPTTFEGSTLLIRGRLKRDQYRSGEYLVTNISTHLFLVFSNPAHLLKNFMHNFSRNADLVPVSVHIEPESDDVELENDRVFIVHGKLASNDGILELEILPEAKDPFEKTVIALVSGDKCLLGKLARHNDTRVRLLFKISSGT